jgi:hypothetical protein
MAVKGRDPFSAASTETTGIRVLIWLCGDMRATGDTVTPTRREVVYQIGEQLS